MSSAGKPNPAEGGPPMKTLQSNVDASLAPIVTTLVALAQSFVHALAVELSAELANSRRETEIDQRSVAELRELRLTPRVYMEAARKREFRSSKRGRLIVACRRDVEAWLDHRAEPMPVESEHEAAASTALEDEVRAEMGLLPKRIPFRVVSGARTGRLR